MEPKDAAVHSPLTPDQRRRLLWMVYETILCDPGNQHTHAPALEVTASLPSHEVDVEEQQGDQETHGVAAAVP